MTNQEKYGYWHKISMYDLETAKILLDANRGFYVAVLCLQALERLLKGMIVFHSGKEAPKSHNITFLIDKLAQEDMIKNDDEISFDDQKDEYMDFFVELMYYYVNDYPFSYKKVLNRFIDQSVAQELYRKTVEVFKWLEGFQE